MTTTETAEARDRIERYIAEYTDAPNLSSPAIYPAAPKIADLRALLNASLTPPAQGGEWRSIESAPKDGRRVLLWLGQPWSRVELAAWYDLWGTWISEEPIEMDEVSGIGALIPTHWMHLPPAPTAMLSAIPDASPGSDREDLREAMRAVWLEAHETIPPDGKAAAFAALGSILRIASKALATPSAPTASFMIGDRVEKKGGSSWRGQIVGTYSTSLTPEGYAVESENEPGSVQIYPAKALRLARSASTAERLRSALEEAESVLALVEPEAFADPAYEAAVEAMGARIGFGNLMSTASAIWRRRAPVTGGEFVAGPCHATVVNTLAKIRAALSEAGDSSHD